LKPVELLKTDVSGGLPYDTWAGSARGLRHRRTGFKSTSLSHFFVHSSSSSLARFLSLSLSLSLDSPFDHVVCRAKHTGRGHVTGSGSSEQRRHARRVAVNTPQHWRCPAHDDAMTSRAAKIRRAVPEICSPRWSRDRKRK